jgi:hypothetical protein
MTYLCLTRTLARQDFQGKTLLEELLEEVFWHTWLTASEPFLRHPQSLRPQPEADM